MGGGLEDSSKSTAGKPWDQFAANEARFGIKSNYEENLYTTKLDRSGKDFRNREREADRIAREIMGQATNNPHLAEERGQIADDSGINEEDKYGAVVRNPNAYVPPALRKQMAAASAAAGGGGKKASPGAPTATPQATSKPNGATAAAPTAASVSANASPAAAAPTPVSTQTTTTPPPPVAVNPPVVNVKVPSPSIPQEPYSSDATGKKQSVDAANPLMGDFRSFVSSERERLERRRRLLPKRKRTRASPISSPGPAPLN